MKRFTILVIDNQAGNSISLEQILVVNDFEVKVLSMEEEIFRFINEETVDLVFIEADLPEMQSFSICRAIKSNDKWSVIPVIFMVDRDNLELISEIFESGADDYILKPLLNLEILTKSRALLELKYGRQIARNTNQMLETRVGQRTRELEDSLKMLRQAYKDLEILEIAKSEFFNLVSHEIRTPLNGILGSLALIERFELPEEVNRYFMILGYSAKRLEKFSNTIIEASALRIKGERAMVYVDNDIITIIQKALDQVSLEFPEKNMEIDIQNNATNLSLRGDEKYLIKCFAVVFENAFKFSSIGGRVEVIIINETEGNLKITIADYGIGFSKVSLDNIFKAMSNLDAHVDKNTGMGLHIAKLIIEAHSGSIRVGNRMPSGAFVEIKIPVKQPA